MVHDQADELRQLIRKSNMHGDGAPTLPLIIVSGGKGGLGTSTLATNLAVAFARQGRRALLVDADLDHGGHLIEDHRQGGSIADVLANRRKLQDVLERGPAGIQVLSGAWPAGEIADVSAAAQQRFIEQLKHLTSQAQIAVVDAGSRRDHYVRRFWQAANIVLVVTTTDAGAIMECYAAIKVLLAGDASAPVRTLVNFASDARSAREVQSRIVAACRRFLGLRVTPAGHVPSHAAHSGESVLIYSSRSESARALDRLADTLWDELQLSKAGDTVGRLAAMSA